MKRLVDSLPNGGVPFENEDILILQNEGFNSLKQILVGLATPLVLSGCAVPRTFRTNSNFTGGGGVGTPTTRPTMGPGYVWLDGDIRYFAGFTYDQSTTFYIKSDIPVNDKATLQDGTLKNKYVTTNAIAVLSQPTTGEYITCTPAAAPYFIDVVNRPVKAALDAEIATRQSQNTAEVTARSNADTQLNQRINTLSDTVDTKARKLCERIDWTDLVLSPGYTTAPNGQYQTAQYMRDEFGFVHLRGLLVNGTQYTKANSYGGTTVCTLPIGARPTFRAEFVRQIVYNFYGSVPNACAFTTNYLSLQSNGGFSVNTQYFLVDPNNAVSTAQAKSDASFYLDDISYFSL